MICWFSILPLDVLKSRVQIGEEEKNCHISLYYKCFLLVCIVTQPQELALLHHARITFLLQCCTHFCVCTSTRCEVTRISISL